MDRPCRAAAKVKNFRRYHLSGNLKEEVSGLVDTRVGQFEMVLSTDQVKAQLQEEKEVSRRLQEDVEWCTIENEVESEKNEQEQ